MSGGGFGGLSDYQTGDPADLRQDLQRQNLAVGDALAALEYSRAARPAVRFAPQPILTPPLAVAVNELLLVAPPAAGVRPLIELASGTDSDIGRSAFICKMPNPDTNNDGLPDGPDTTLMVQAAAHINGVGVGSTGPQADFITSTLAVVREYVWLGSQFGWYAR